MMNDVLFHLENIRKTYCTDKGERIILDIPSLDLLCGISCILGISGVGKTTLLAMLGLLEEPDPIHPDGEPQIVYHAQNQKILYQKLWRSWWNRRKAVQVRGDEFGFIYQESHLFGHLTALQNVILARCMQNHCPKHQAVEESRSLLTDLQLITDIDRSQSYPEELSGGERQRVALARAMIKHPNVLFCDEPTGNLDEVNKDLVISKFKALQAKYPNCSIIMVTHDISLAIQFADRLYMMKKGRLAIIPKENWDKMKIRAEIKNA